MLGRARQAQAGPAHSAAPLRRKAEGAQEGGTDASGSSCLGLGLGMHLGHGDKVIALFGDPLSDLIYIYIYRYIYIYIYI